MAEQGTISIRIYTDEKVIPRLEQQVESLRGKIHGLDRTTAAYAQKSEQLKKYGVEYDRLTERVKKLQKAYEEENDRAKKNALAERLSKAQLELAQASEKVKVLKNSIDGLDQSSQEYAETLNELTVKERALEIARLKANGTLSATSNDLKKIIKKLKEEIAELPEETEEFVEKTKLLHQAEKEFKRLEAQITGVDKKLEASKQRWSWFWATVGGSALGEITSNVIQNVFGNIQEFFNGIFQNFVKLEDALADIGKTTGLTKNQLKGLKAELQSLNTRTTMEDLLKIAEIVGQMTAPEDVPIGSNMKDYVVQVSKTLDIINVALGSEMGNDVERLTKEVSAFLKIFNVNPNDSPDVRLLKIANAFNALSASGSTTLDKLTDYGSRLGPVLTKLGFTAEQVLGIAATLDELRINPELGATAVNNIIKTMASNLADFAKISQMSLKDFEDLVNNNVYNAFIKVIEGANKFGDSTTEMAKLLQLLELNGQGTSTVFLSLGKNTDYMARRIAVAGENISNTNGIMEEFRVKNENVAGDLAKLQKNLASMFAMPAITSAFESIIGYLTKITEKTYLASQAMKDEQYQVNLLANELSLSNTPAERRVQILKELQAIAPVHFKNLDLEKNYYDQLRNSLSTYNQEMVKRLELQIKDEKLTKEKNIALEKARALDAKRQEIVEFATNKKSMLFSNVDLERPEPKTDFGNLFDFSQKNEMNIKDLVWKARSFAEKYSFSEFAKQRLLNRLTDMSLEYSALEGDLNLQIREVGKLEASRMNLQKKLEETALYYQNLYGSKTEPKKTENPDDGSGKLDLGGDSKVPKEAQEKLTNEFLESYLKARESILGDFEKGLPFNEALNALNSIYDELRQTVIENGKYLVSQDLLSEEQLDTTLKANEINRAKAIAALREKFRNEQLEKEKENQAKLAEAKQNQADKDFFDEKINLLKIENEKDRQRKKELEAEKKFYQDLRDEAKKFYELKLLDKEDYALALEFIDKREKEAQAKKQAESDADEKTQRLEHLRDTAEMYGETTSAISQMFGAMNDFIAASGIKNAKLVKALTVFKIAADTATAIAANVAGAATAALQGGPAYPFLLVAYITSGLATIFSAISQAKAVLNSKPVPTNSDYTSNNQPNKREGYRKFAKGDYIDFGNSHENGGTVVEVEKGEMIFNKRFVANNKAFMFDLLKVSQKFPTLKFPKLREMAEAKRAAMLSPVIVPQNQNNENEELKELREMVKMTMAAVLESANKPVINSLQRLNDEQDRLNTIQQKSKI